MIHLKFLVDTDYANYKKTSMFVGIGISCTWKCGKVNCQNTKLAKEKIIEISEEDVVNQYLKNSLTHAIVLGGLEPLDNIKDTLKLVHSLRLKTNDDIIIYTGYEESENETIKYVENELSKYPNIIIKYGRFVPDQPKHFDEILGVELASLNQYAKKIKYKENTNYENQT